MMHVLFAKELGREPFLSKVHPLQIYPKIINIKNGTLFLV